MIRSSLTDWGLLWLRLGSSALLVGLHGVNRLTRTFNYLVLEEPWTFVNVVAGLGFPFPVFFAILSTLAESVATLFVALGLWTRTFSLFVAGNMSVAFYAEASKGDPFELPALYLIAFLTLVVAGPGKFALDPAFARR